MRCGRSYPAAIASPPSWSSPATTAPPLTPADLGAIKQQPVVVSDDGKAAVATVPLDAGLSGFALNDAVKALRESARDGLPGDLRVEVTGGPAFGADIANSFSGANITLLAVTAAVVALLLIVTYRSPVLWLVPLAGDRLRRPRRRGRWAARSPGASGMTPDGSTSGITSVLVFGAGTNYALLLISRYREELGRNENHRDALGIAVRQAGPAIVASNATVVLALLTLLLASSPSTRSLGVQAAAGLVVAAVFVLLVLPPLLALFGKRLFWPFIPQVGAKPLTDSGIWHRIADAVARGPAGSRWSRSPALALLCTGLLEHTDRPVADRAVPGAGRIGQRVRDTGRALPQRPDRSHPRHRRDGQGTPRSSRRSRHPGCRVRRPPAAQSPGGLSRSGRWCSSAAPASDEAFETIDALRDSVHAVDPDALVGGSDAHGPRRRAQPRTATGCVIIPAILAVVLVVLYVLLRSALAPLILVAVTVLSALAALGLGGWASVHVFGFPALDNTAPLFAFLFLVALGVDYTIFLVTRAREETPGARHPRRASCARCRRPARSSPARASCWPRCSACSACCP